MELNFGLPYTKNIVKEYFSAVNKMGIIRMRENRYFRQELPLDDFMSIMKEAFQG
jgi:hypothetical protein